MEYLFLCRPGPRPSRTSPVPTFSSSQIWLRHAGSAFPGYVGEDYLVSLCGAAELIVPVTWCDPGIHPGMLKSVSGEEGNWLSMILLFFIFLSSHGSKSMYPDKSTIFRWYVVRAPANHPIEVSRYSPLGGLLHLNPSNPNGRQFYTVALGIRLGYVLYRSPSNKVGII